MSTYIPENLRTQIAEHDKKRCCYCLTTEANSGIPMTHDHILAVSKGGDIAFPSRVSYSRRGTAMLCPYILDEASVPH